ncbi:MAG TPA: acetyltransferase [Gammaproteobacteria bacterium]|nr:acetyltransferase [Gammaproteobacteria bacterium]
MYLKHRSSGSLVEVLDTAALADPCHATVKGRFHAGEELQEAADFAKAELIFPSGEALPRCWLDPNYKHN